MRGRDAAIVLLAGLQAMAAAVVAIFLSPFLSFFCPRQKASITYFCSIFSYAIFCNGALFFFHVFFL